MQAVVTRARVAQARDFHRAEGRLEAALVHAPLGALNTVGPCDRAGQHHAVVLPVVVGAVAGDVVDPDAAVPHHRLGPLVALPLGRHAVERPQLQPFGLLDVEDVLDLHQRPVA